MFFLSNCAAYLKDAFEWDQSFTLPAVRLFIKQRRFDSSLLLKWTETTNRSKRVLLTANYSQKFQLLFSSMRRLANAADKLVHIACMQYIPMLFRGWLCVHRNRRLHWGRYVPFLHLGRRKDPVSKYDVGIPLHNIGMLCMLSYSAGAILPWLHQFVCTLLHKADETLS